MLQQFFTRIEPQIWTNAVRHRHIRDEPTTLVFVHIGKCGGASLWDAINQSDRLKQNYRHFHKIHDEKPPVGRSIRYVVSVRNPISRAISAFNWRHKLVIEDAVQPNRFRGEREVLLRYGTLNALAEQLVDEQGINKRVARDFHKIHHIRENYAFYLNGILDSVSADQIVGVIATETLAADVAQQLGVGSVVRTHDNAAFTDPKMKTLSDRAYENLQQVLAPDYLCLRRLIQLNQTSLCAPDILLA